jgi:SET domain-containing protein
LEKRDVAKRNASKPRTKKTLPFELRRSSIQGRGAFATQRIRKGARIIEYTGEIISVEESDKRYDDGAMGRHHTFLFSLDNGYVIDGAVNGNEAAYINHSCDPNCEAVDVKGKIFIEALRTIYPGEELCYDYAYEREGFEDAKWEKLYVCRCGAANCRGTILAPPKKSTTKKASATAKRGVKRQAKSRRSA